MAVPQLLEVAAHGTTAILGVWLGLTVITRSSAPSARVFGLLAITVAVWSTSVIIGRLSTVADARLVAGSVEEFAAALVIAGTAHVSLAVVSEGHIDARHRLVMVGIYLLNVAFALPTIINRGVSPPELAGAADTLAAAFGWAWVIVRLGTLGLAAWWLVAALRRPDLDTLRRRQLIAALATIATGAVGAALRMLPGISAEEPWIGVSFVTLAIILATYAVLSAGIFFGPAVAGRAFRSSLLGGLALVALVALFLAIEAIGRVVIGLDVPVFMALALVVVVAAYEPIAARVRPLLAGPGAGAARDALLRAIGGSDLGTQPAEEGVQPALRRLAGAIDVTGIAIVDRSGGLVAAEGEQPSSSVLAIPLDIDGETLGELRVGPSTSGSRLDSRDEALIRLSATYVAAALRAGRREAEEAGRLARLAAERASVEAQATTLHAALVRHGSAPDTVRVHALGPLRVERGDERIRRWGGDKAGSRQAEALFAFLFDRGERGVAKDEVLELIWPDTDFERADLAFHRTMVGLRRTLDPETRGRDSLVIRFHNDRYRMDPTIVDWSDVGDFLTRLAAARDAPTAAQRTMLLEEARALYRGEYLDDCPFYGDSEYVDDNRSRYRGHLVDLLVALGESYEAAGDRVSAAAAYREARTAAGDGCPPAEAGLARLGM